MRIGIIVGEFPQPSETFILHHVAALLDGGHDVSIFACRRPTSRVIHEVFGQYDLSARVHYLPRQPWGLKQLAYAPASMIESLGRAGAARCLNVRRYGSGALRLSALHALPTFARAEFDLLHCHYAAIGWAFLSYRDIFRVPFVTSFHGEHYARFGRGPSAHLKPLFRLGDAFVANGAFLRGELLRLGCPADRIHVTPAPVTDAGVEFRPRPAGIPGPGGHIRILCVAHLKPGKGVHVLLDAVSRLRLAGHRAELTIVGDGSERAALEAQRDRLDLVGAVSFAGWCTQAGVFAHLRSTDVLVLPSVGNADGVTESQGLVLQEAMLHGVPVVASAIGGVPESLDGGAAGALTPPGDAEALAATIVRIASDPARTLATVRAAEAYVRARYLKESACRAHEAIYAAAQAHYALTTSGSRPRATLAGHLG
jgi:colanic acid/amylovoran biosynthesis glycosyltransferase